MSKTKKALWRRAFWPVVGCAAIAISFWFLAQELRHMSWEDLAAGFAAITGQHWLLILLCTGACYFILALYDVLALQHLKRRLNFIYVAATSLTTYALAHTIGASAFTGAVIRYRAYSAKGLSAGEVGILVTFCSLTFSLGVMVVVGLAFLLAPSLEDRLAGFLAQWVVQWLAIGVLVLVGLYLLGAALKLPVLKIRKFEISYPSLWIAIKQVIIAPTELVFAAGILYFALPETGNPGFIIVMGVFVVAFALALLSHAPGGLGVFELVVLAGLPEFEPEAVIAGLLVFRLVYFMVPLVTGLVMVALFEHGQFRQKTDSQN